MSVWKFGGLLSFMVLLFAVYYRRSYDNEDQLREKLDTVLASLLRAEKKATVQPRTRIAIGLGACQDAFAHAVPLLEKLQLKPPTSAKHHGSIKDDNELGETFAFFFSRGAAGERYLHDKDLFEDILEEAQQDASIRWALGGNAPVMANRLATEGCEVLLGARMSQKLREQLHEGIKGRYVHDKNLLEDILEVAERMPGTRWAFGGNAAYMANRLAMEGYDVLLGARMSDNLKLQLHERVKVAGSPLDKDDVHLLLEYKTGEVWGDFRTPRANRFIIHSDSSNPRLESLNDFKTDLLEFEPDAVVIGGLQMMDNFPFAEGERQERLADLQSVLMELSPDSKTHFEFASFAEESMLHDLMKYVVPYMDSIGMNEQELPNLFSLLQYGNVSLISDPYPRTATVLDQMRYVFDKLRKTPAVGRQRRVSRLHVHTLAFQAIMTTKDSGWKNTMSAAAKAALTANRYVCGNSKVDLTKSKIIMDESFRISEESGSKRMPFHDERPVSCWEEGDVEICVAPVLVCTDIFVTAGGGDNISSAGLVLQV